MFQNHIKLAFRHLLKSKVYSAIHIIGLAVGMASFFLMIQYAAFELSFDRFHENASQIYRVAHEQYKNGELKNSSAATFFGVSQFLKDNFPEVQEVTRFYQWPANTGAVLMADGKVFNERNYFFAEPSFFQVFPTLLSEGDKDKCLKNPNSVVLSRRLAEKMFGTDQVMGKMVSRLDKENTTLEVTGIMMDMPANSHFDLDVVIPYDQEWIPDKKGTWLFPNNLTYLVVEEGTNSRAIEDKLNVLLSKEQRENPEYIGSRSVLQPLTDIHFSAYQREELKGNVDRKVVYGIGIAAVVILVLAWINYINLETSRFLMRMRETGVRRIVGSSKAQLIGQFFMQFFGLVVLAIGLAAILVVWVTPFYHDLTGAEFASLSGGMSWLPVVAGGIFLFGSVLTGIYPALFLVGLNPIASLRGKLLNTHVPAIKKALLTFQLVSSLGLLAFLFVVARQLDFMRTISKGMELDHVLTIYNPTSYSVHEDTLKKERLLGFRNLVLENPSIRNLTSSSIVPGEPVGFTYHNLTKRSLSDPDDNVPYKVVFVDYYFIPVYNLKLLAGRNYATDSGEDNNLNSLVLNESAIRALGFNSPEEALNQEINFMVTWDWKKYKIIGIVEDYRHESVKMPVYPTVFFLHKYVGQMTYYSLLIDGKTDMQDNLAHVEEAWKKIWPEKPFIYFFADQHYDQQYKSEIYLGRIFMLFSAVAVFLACLGVLGMTLFEANSRLREISIRKVLGATILNLITLLTRDNFKVVMLSLILAVPFIYFFTTRWLSGYPVRIDISLRFFLYPFIGLLLLVGVTSITQALRAANSNPVQHLKHE